MDSLVMLEKSYNKLRNSKIRQINRTQAQINELQKLNLSEHGLIHLSALKSRIETTKDMLDCMDELFGIEFQDDLKPNK